MNLQKSADAHTKVLIVDSDPVIVKAIAAELRLAGYETLKAVGGGEAIALVRQEKPDLIVLDLNVSPDIHSVPSDGYHIMECLRRVKESRTIPIITMTGNPDSLDMERNIDLGAVGFLYKPLDYDELLRLVRGAVGAKAMVEMAA
jgi:two-component system KDP operon response regulator KdpE